MPRQIPHRVHFFDHHFAHAIFARVDLDHQEQCEVIQNGRDARHQQYVEVGDLQELGNQEGGGAEHRRRDDCADAAGGEQAAGGVFLVTGLGQHRIGDRAQRHRGRDARSGRPPQQERRKHHRAPGAGGLAAHRRE